MEHKDHPPAMSPSEMSPSHHVHPQVRVSSRAKTDAVLRLLKGESVESLSDELGVTIGRVERWKSKFVAAGSAELAKRSDQPSKNWLQGHLQSATQWIWLLLTLVVVISVLVLFMQRGSE